MLLAVAFVVPVLAVAQDEPSTVLPGRTSLEEFRRRALESNKQLMISRERMR